MTERESISSGMYRVIQLNFTPEIDVFHMLIDRYLPILSMTSLKRNFRV